MGYGEQQIPPTTALYRLPVRSLRCAVSRPRQQFGEPLQLLRCPVDGQCAERPRTRQWEHKKVLIVEDALVIRMVVAKFVADFGHAVIEAADGQEGLIAARREHPDLIISDVHMPKMDGMEFVTTLHQDENMREVPIVMLTGEKNIETIKLAMKSGVNDYILKDISNPSAFRDRLKKYL